MGYYSYDDENAVRHYVPVHPECFYLTMIKKPALPKELELYKHSWESMPQMTAWDKFWGGIR